MADDQLSFGDDERSVALRRAWDRTLQNLSARVSKGTFESFIAPIRPLSWAGHDVILGVTSPFAREWLDKRHRNLVRSTLEVHLGITINLEFRVLTPAERAPVATLEQPTPVPATPALGQAPPKRRNGEGFRADFCLPPVERFTFDQFVVGRTNRLAQAAAAAVAEKPGKSYNPLFLYGNCGLGKTHLLHAIANTIRARNDGTFVALVDGDTFTQQYVAAVREHRMEAFRRHYRNVDVWLVDDTQMVAGKHATCEEFFHTYNALFQTGRQIVLAADKSPRELGAMDERLRTRFEGGLVADVTPPQYETRLAILQHRCHTEGWEVPEPVLEYVADAIQSNCRALEGAVTKLVAYSSVMGAPICLELARDVLAEFFISKPLPGERAKGVSMAAILRAVSQRTGVSEEAMRGLKRDARIAAARQVAMYLARDLDNLTLAQIGEVFSGREHTTVQRSIARVEALLTTCPETQGLLLELKSKLSR